MEKEFSITEEELERLRAFRPMDDTFARVIFRNNIPLVEMVLRIILGNNTLKVFRSEVQYDLKRLLGSRSLCLDVCAFDENGEVYDIEIQKDSGGAISQRADYHMAALSVENLKVKEDFSKLPIRYVIFITEKDVIGNGYAVNDFAWCNVKTHELLDNRAHIVYVNGACKDDGTNVSKLMHDFRCNNPDDMCFEELAEVTKYYKEEKGGQGEMCDIMREMTEKAKAEGIEKGRKEGQVEGRLEVALDLVKEGTPLEEAARLAKLPKEKIKEAMLDAGLNP